MLFDHLQKTKKEYKFNETVDFRHIYENEVDKDWFQQDITCGGCKDLTRRTDPNKILCDKV